MATLSKTRSDGGCDDGAEPQRNLEERPRRPRRTEFNRTA